MRNIIPLSEALERYRLGLTLSRYKVVDQGIGQVQKQQVIVVTAKAIHNQSTVDLTAGDEFTFKNTPVKQSLKLGSVLATTRFTQFSAAYVDALPSLPLFATNNLIVLEPKPFISSEYLTLCLKSDGVWRQIQNKASTQTAKGTPLSRKDSFDFYSIGLDAFCSILIPVPALEVQAAIVQEYYNVLVPTEHDLIRRITEIKSNLINIRSNFYRKYF